MLVRSLRISKYGETYRFEEELRGRDLVGPVPPLVPPAAERYVQDHLVAQLRDCIDKVSRSGQSPGRETILEWGCFLDNDVLPPEILELLRSTKTAVLIITADAPLPWELAGVVGEGDAATCLAERVPVGRYLVARGPSSPGAEQPTDLNRRSLIIADPTEELKETREEAAKLARQLDKMGFRADTLLGHTATFDEVRHHLQSKRYGFIHFCGHVVPHLGGGGALELSDVDLAAASIPGDLGRPFVFLNACASATSAAQPGQQTSVSEFVAGVAQGFINGGARGVIGTLWRIDDRAARLFAELFYANVLAGKTIGEAMLEARLLVHRDTREAGDEQQQPDAGTLAGFVLYGDPRLRLAPRVTPPGVWPPPERLTEECAQVLRNAARVALAGEGTLTSAHLCWALLSLEDGPLVRWMRSNHHPLEEAREVFVALVEPEDAQAEAEELEGEPELSTTIEKLWRWVEDQPADHAVSLEELTEEFADLDGGVSGEILAWLGIDLSAYPDPQPPPPWDAQARQAIEIARDTSRWNEGVASTSHLMLGILEVGNNALCECVQQRTRSYERTAQKLRQRLTQGRPDPAPVRAVASPNMQLILRAAQRLRRQAGREEGTVEDLLEAALSLEAGALGSALTQMGFSTSASEARSGPRPKRISCEQAPSAIRLDADATLLLNRAARCAFVCGHNLVGTPHLLAAGLRFDEALRAVLGDLGHEPDRVLATLVQVLAPERADDLFEAAEGTPLSAIFLSRNLAATAERALGRLPDSKQQLTSRDLLLAVLAHTGGQAVALLERSGADVAEVIRRLEEHA